jgi:hypothetical protein
VQEELAVAIRKAVPKRLSPTSIGSLYAQYGHPLFPRGECLGAAHRSRLALTNVRWLQEELAVAIRKAVPKLLRAAIVEVYYGRSTRGANKQCNDGYIDFALRTYLLIHQARGGGGGEGGGQRR